jgi:integrase
MAKALTVEAVKKLKPRPVRREVPDALMPGLYLVIQPSGKKSWALRFRLGGRPRKFTLGEYPVIELDEAREQARTALLAAKKEGCDPLVERRKTQALAAIAIGDTVTIEDAVKQYIKVYCRPANRSWRETARTLGLKPDPDDENRFTRTGNGIVANWGGRLVRDISDYDVQTRLDTIAAKYPQAANQEHAFLRKFFRWCVSRKIITASPCKDVERPADPVDRDRVLIDAELRQVWLAAAKLAYPFGDIVRLLILTGQRRNEVAGMQWCEIDQAARMWTIPKERRKSRNKTAKPLDVPLSDAALDIISKLPRIKSDKGFLFTTTGNSPISGFSKWKSKLDDIIRKADGDVAPWRLHDLRRTLATGLQKLGIRLEVTEAVLGHTSGSRAGIVGIYQRHDWASEKRVALDAWAQHVLALTAEQDDNVVHLRSRS